MVCRQKALFSRKVAWWSRDPSLRSTSWFCWLVLPRYNNNNNNNNNNKGRLHFIPDKAKVNAQLYVETLLPRLIEDCKSDLSSGFISSRTVRLLTARLAQGFIATNCSEFIGNDEWPPSSPDLNPLDYHVWVAMLERYKTFHPKPKNIDELKKVLQLIWNQLPQDSINKAILSFTKRLRACVKARGGDFEHALR